MALKVKNQQPDTELAEDEQQEEAPACLAPDSKTCPGESGKDSPYMYQKGCRGEACKLANRRYYKAWRDAKKAEAAEETEESNDDE